MSVSATATFRSWIKNCGCSIRISPPTRTRASSDTAIRVRPRKLLLHRREINRIITKLRENGMTAIPLQIYLERGRAKVEIGVARGKRQYDKRADLAKRDANRQIERALKER